MSNCFDSPVQTPSNNGNCPVCQVKGKSVAIITLKSLLKPEALETLHADSSYSFCANPTCDVVYFNRLQLFHKEMLKAPVYQKDHDLNVPVCYCFNWTRERLVQAIENNMHPTDCIREHMNNNRCGCEVNNPQGSCCLGNITAYIQGIQKE